MAVLAERMARAARDREDIADSGLGGRLQEIGAALGLRRGRGRTPREQAMHQLALRLDADVRRTTDRLIELHGLSGHAAATVLTRLAEHVPSRPEYVVARAETNRLRAASEDLDKAVGDYKAVLSAEGAPAEAYRGLGMIQRLRKQPDEARTNLLRYLELAPKAPDAAMIKSYVEELNS